MGIVDGYIEKCRDAQKSTREKAEDIGKKLNQINKKKEVIF